MYKAAPEYVDMIQSLVEASDPNNTEEYDKPTLEILAAYYEYNGFDKGDLETMEMYHQYDLLLWTRGEFE